MSAALKIIPTSDDAEKLSQNSRLGKKLCKPVLVWKNPALSLGMHKEKPKAKLRCMSGGKYLFLYTDPDGKRIYRHNPTNPTLHEMLENLDDPRLTWSQPNLDKPKLISQKTAI